MDIKFPPVPEMKVGEWKEYARHSWAFRPTGFSFAQLQAYAEETVRLNTEKVNED